MKAILMSIRSQHLANILNGIKTIELRTRFPKDFRGWVYLYCTKGKPYLTRIYGEWDLTKYGCEESPSGNVRTVNGKVVCRFWVDNVEEIVLEYILENEQFEVVFENHTTKETEDKLKSMCLTLGDFLYYHYKSLKSKKDGFVMSKAIHISKLEIFDKPKKLAEFYYFKKRLIDCGMDCPPYFDEVKTQVRKAPQSWRSIYIEEDKQVIRKDIYGDWWYNDDEGEHEAINLTELFGKGNEPQTDDEVIKIIKEKQRFFKAQERRWNNMQKQLEARNKKIAECLERTQTDLVKTIREVEELETEIGIEKVIDGDLSKQAVAVEVNDLYELLKEVSRLLR